MKKLHPTNLGRSSIGIEFRLQKAESEAKTSPFDYIDFGKYEPIYSNNNEVLLLEDTTTGEYYKLVDSYGVYEAVTDVLNVTVENDRGQLEGEHPNINRPIMLTKDPLKLQVLTLLAPDGSIFKKSTRYPKVTTGPILDRPDPTKDKNIDFSYTTQKKAETEDNSGNSKARKALAANTTHVIQSWGNGDASKDYKREGYVFKSTPEAEEDQKWKYDQTLTYDQTLDQFIKATGLNPEYKKIMTKPGFQSQNFKAIALGQFNKSTHQIRQISTPNIITKDPETGKLSVKTRLIFLPTFDKVTQDLDIEIRIMITINGSLTSKTIDYNSHENFIMDLNLQSQNMEDLTDEEIYTAINDAAVRHKLIDPDKGESISQPGCYTLSTLIDVDGTCDVTEFSINTSIPELYDEDIDAVSPFLADNPDDAKQIKLFYTNGSLTVEESLPIIERLVVAGYVSLASDNPLGPIEHNIRIKAIYKMAKAANKSPIELIKLDAKISGLTDDPLHNLSQINTLLKKSSEPHHNDFGLKLEKYQKLFNKKQPTDIYQKLFNKKQPTSIYQKLFNKKQPTYIQSAFIAASVCLDSEDPLTPIEFNTRFKEASSTTDVQRTPGLLSLSLMKDFLLQSPKAHHKSLGQRLDKNINIQPADIKPLKGDIEYLIVAGYLSHLFSNPLAPKELNNLIHSFYQLAKTENTTPYELIKKQPNPPIAFPLNTPSLSSLSMLKDFLLKSANLNHQNFGEMLNNCVKLVFEQPAYTQTLSQDIKKIISLCNILLEDEQLTIQEATKKTSTDKQDPNITKTIFSLLETVKSKPNHPHKDFIEKNLTNLLSTPKTPFKPSYLLSTLKPQITPHQPKNLSKILKKRIGSLVEPHDKAKPVKSQKKRRRSL